MPSPDTEDVCARLERLKKLCGELESAQHDNLKYRQLMERIRTEADAFRQILGTHDTKA